MLRRLSFISHTHTRWHAALLSLTPSQKHTGPTAVRLYFIDAAFDRNVKVQEKERNEIMASRFFFPIYALHLQHRQFESWRLSCNIGNAADTVPIFHVPTWQVAATTYTCRPQRRLEYFLASSKLSVAKATAYFCCCSFSRNLCFFHFLFQPCCGIFLLPPSTEKMMVPRLMKRICFIFSALH